jgi:hypothetical protein
LGEVAAVLGVVRRRSTRVRTLFAEIEEIERQRTVFVEAFDLRRVEIKLRAELTRQIWGLLIRSSRRVADPDGAYARALTKVRFPGQRQFLATLDAMLAESRHGISEASGNLFASEEYFAGDM